MKTKLDPKVFVRAAELIHDGLSDGIHVALHIAARERGIGNRKASDFVVERFLIGDNLVFCDNSHRVWSLLLAAAIAKDGDNTLS